jgi:proteasome lid subunit RPN8/RPN11
MTVFRQTPLPRRPGRGQLIVTDAVLEPSSAALRSSRGPDGPHEGLVLWLGRTVGDDTLVLALATPPIISSAQRVHVDERAVAAAARVARQAGLGVVAQVHSHPATDTRHSDGDDQLIFMPFEGMFSLVVADYGRGSLHPAEGAGLHQRQNGQWVQVIDPHTMRVIPAHLHDARAQ